jgi:hypothetical protein
VSAAQELARDPATIRRIVDEALAQPEFSQPERGESWLGRVLKDVLEWLEDVLGLGPGQAAEVLLYVLYAMIAALFLVIVVSLLRRLRARGSEASAADPALVRAERVRELLLRARAARSRGDLVDALRLHFWALVIGLSERGDLEYRDAWTNRELLQRGRPRESARGILEPLVPRLDAQSFGREPVGEADVDALADLCRRHLGSEAA